MRTPNQNSRDQLVAALARRSAASASELARQAGVSVPTLHRLLKELGAQVLVTGKARRARYGLRRALRGDSAPLPLYRIDAQGRAEPVARLALVHPQGVCADMAATGWPAPKGSLDGWWDGLPYPLYDMRPQGFMGRQLARAEHRQLGVSANPQDWSDDDILFVLCRHGADVSGDLLLGDIACERWMAAKRSPADPARSKALGVAYSKLAEQALASGVAGSSAAGEFPKFPALRDIPGSQTPHVLVKFSGADGSATVRRWSDLLVAEHLALQCAATLEGIESARSRILQSGGRTFLEVERFDRHGAFGRSGLCCLAALEAALIGDGSADWARLAGQMAAAGWLGAADVQRIDRLWWFGRLIANSDMHAGNLSFRPRQSDAGKHVELAPAYDMLPMLYAPLPGGELGTRGFEPPLPLPAQRPAWSAACVAALLFWNRVAEDKRIGEGFRHEGQANAQKLAQLAEQA